MGPLEAEGHELDGVEGVATVEDGDLVVLLESDDCGADLFEFVAGAGDFAIGAVGLEVVGEDALPVGLLVGGDGGPVPVLDHVGAVGEVGVDVFAQLAVVGRVLVGGGPAEWSGRWFR